MCPRSGSETEPRAVQSMNIGPAITQMEENELLFRNTNVDLIEPGLVIIRNFITDEECRRIAHMARVIGGNGEDGFFTLCPKSGNQVLNTGESRGRIYDKASRFLPLEVLQYSTDAVALACQVDATMPNMDCTHVMLNMYTTSEGLVWHRDIYENDGKSDHPVVNMSIGATCVFGFKHEDTDEERTVELRSGDMILFGGRCRLIKHAVLSINLEDCPKWMKEDPCRFSFTFRDSPEVIGRENEFKYFRVKEHLVGQDKVENSRDPKKFSYCSSLPGQSLSAIELAQSEPDISL